ncbi:hypothetical protein ILUMI_23045 [Ignelater luminosus]|uniref:Sulfotransferase domain-containing protein n=1 Tax=Ignelater luminosus TaxID=2038154 RepID=A0A8K0CEM0_IGNLU|nr:hypothetical protein ILUMI_23045 [Ignelater luminosus]
MSISSEVIKGFYGEKLDQVYGVKNSFYAYNPGKCVMPPQFAEIAQQISSFKVRKDDVWMISFPRAGSTWCQEMVWLIGNDLDFASAKQYIQQIRAPVLELSAIFVTEEYSEYMKNYGNSVERARNHPSPRFIKSHLPLTLLPSELNEVKPKIIYVARNPKDVCVSYYNHSQHFYNLPLCTFEEFADLFLNDKLPFSPLWPHYLEFWKRRHEDNFLFLKYEDMKKDLLTVILKIAEFLGKTLSDEQINILIEYLSFNNMKSNQSVNMEPVLNSRTGKFSSEMVSQDFIRSGKIGDGEKFMTLELSKRFDEWIQENTKGTGLTF